jgi:hypothetical protein
MCPCNPHFPQNKPRHATRDNPAFVHRSVILSVIPKWPCDAELEAAPRRVRKQKIKLCRYSSCRRQRERVYSFYSFLTSAPDGVSSQIHTPTGFSPRETTPGTHWLGGWLDLRAGLDTEARGKILCLCQGLNPGRSVCSQTQKVIELHSLPPHSLRLRSKRWSSESVQLLWGGGGGRR